MRILKLGIIAESLQRLVGKKMTVCFPYEKLDIAEGYRGEHIFDITKCISCGKCAKICLNKAIEMVTAPEALKNQYPKSYPMIDLGKCCFCRLCEDSCPKGALKLSKNFYLATFDKSTVFKSPFSTDT